METAGLYAFGKIFGHQVLSINTVLANRATLKFSKNIELSIERMIQLALQKIATI
jgi:uridine phosphorylase